LTRDERLQCLTLRSVNWEYKQIADKLGYTVRQVRYACNAGHPTPRKKTGRHLKLTQEQANELEVFVCSSRTNRLLDYFTLANGPFRHWGVSEGCIRRTLKALGFKR
ncbi:hypothetical protein B0J12DRAFT_554637, partial [Macrophomina phaseolina]